MQYSLDVNEQGEMRIFVLSSHGHVYVEFLEKANVVFNEGAYFMTNTIQLPSAKNAVSIYYSLNYHFLFVSFQGCFLLSFDRHCQILLVG